MGRSDFMSFILSFLFVILIVVSAFMQASDNALKKVISPGLTTCCGLLVLYGALSGTAPLLQGVVLGVALLFLALSDFTFEASQAKPNLFPLAMIFGVLSGFIIGITFNMVAYLKGVPPLVLIVFLVIGVIAAVLVYRYLKVEQALKIPVFIYLVQAAILMAGGLSSLYSGNFYFAIWGIFLFVSDSLVGIRAFPNPERPIRWLNHYRILFAIIVIYYAAQYALVSWALQY
jgi:F0F1-type ATP synthase assembly protein I